MAITNLSVDPAASDQGAHSSKTKIVFVTFLFLLSLLSFVTQTEFTSQAYQLGFGEPVVLLLVTHGSWWILWPLQALGVSLYRTFTKYRQQQKYGGDHTVSDYIGAGIQYQRLNSHSQLLEDQQQSNEGDDQTTQNRQINVPIQQLNYYKYFKKCVVKQFHNVYHTSILIYEANVNYDKTTDNLNELIDRNAHISSSSSISACVHSFVNTPSIKYTLFKALLITGVLTIAGFTWYGAMAMTYAADVTAIYNCSAFTAYAFAIPILQEKFSWLKASSVIIAISGVFIVAYSGSSGDDKTVDDGEELYPYRFWGNLIILIGAILYGYYEVIYKRYLCVPPHLSKIITPRRQSTFANFVMGLLGFFTCIFVLVTIIVAELFHIHSFNFFNYGDKTRLIWTYIVGSIFSNLIFSASFLSLMALTSPVLSSVSSLLTIFLIGIVEWIMFGNTLGFQQLLGDFLVVIGFVILTVASWKEISEGNEDDDVDAVSTYSFAISTENGA
ncbi:uncharacterized protein RJT20DRAFT_125390 [Scheffersomyces xylosifermentans]|uniref:uncharacterized protein n=1 Tax=Scheffersomyces xylosifermentans TaxID=1304137 RepID=UPI00315CE015